MLPEPDRMRGVGKKWESADGKLKDTHTGSQVKHLILTVYFICPFTSFIMHCLGNHSVMFKQRASMQLAVIGSQTHKHTQLEAKALTNNIWIWLSTFPMNKRCRNELRNNRPLTKPLTVVSWHFSTGHNHCQTTMIGHTDGFGFNFWRISRIHKGVYIIWGNC